MHVWCGTPVLHALDGKVADGVDEGQEGGRVERLAAGAQEAERAGVHTATVHPCTPVTEDQTIR